MATLTHPFEFLARHWRGDNSLLLTALFSVLALSAGFTAALSFWSPQTSGLVLLSCVIGVVLVCWQIVGTIRATDNFSQDHSDFLPVWLCYAALCFAIVQTISSLIGPVVGAYTPDPYVAPVAKGVSVDGSTLQIEGDITLLVNTTVQKHLRETKAIDTIALNSDGGSIHAARGLALTIQERALDTVATGPCRSACTLIFIAGQSRKLGPDGSLGFHKYRIDLPNYSGGKQPSDEQLRDARQFEAQGVKDFFIKKMFEAPHDDIWIPTRAELLIAGVLTP